MRFRKTLIASGVAFLASAGLVLSQTVPVPQVPGVGPTDLFQDVVGGQPTAGNRYATAAAITNVPGYYKSIPATGFEYQFAANVTYAIFNPSGTLATGYLSLATMPTDGARNCFFSTQIITNAYTCASSTAVGNCVTTGINNPTTGQLAANGTVCYTYSASNATWDRSQ